MYELAYIKESASKFKRLAELETDTDCIEVLDIYLNCMFNLILRQKILKGKVWDSEAHLLLQMIFLKSLNLKSNMQGVDFCASGHKLNKLIDPTFIANILRNILETAVLFRVLYSNTKNDNERFIIYNLWRHSGLKYRQKFEEILISDESKKKIKDEAQTLKELKKSIETNELYHSLDSKSVKIIQSMLKSKEYLLQFEDYEVKQFKWSDLAIPLKVKRDFFSKMYNYLSIYAHPTYVSVFQVNDMFDTKNPHFIELATFNFNYLFMTLSIFISDYIKYFPSMLETFNSLELSDQVIIDFRNILSRSRDSSINDSWKIIDSIPISNYF